MQTKVHQKTKFIVKHKSNSSILNQTGNATSTNQTPVPQWQSNHKQNNINKQKSKPQIKLKKHKETENYNTIIVTN